MFQRLVRTYIAVKPEDVNRTDDSEASSADNQETGRDSESYVVDAKVMTATGMYAKETK